jgi:hypothetical protein
MLVEPMISFDENHLWTVLRFVFRQLFVVGQFMITSIQLVLRRVLTLSVNVSTHYGICYE